MKKNIFITLLVIATFIAVPKNSWAQFGIKGGVYTTNFSELNEYKLRHNAGFQAGIAYKANVLPMVTIQPELLYVQKRATVEDQTTDVSEKLDMDYLQLPVSIQFGLNLIVARPFFQVVPYANYLITGSFERTNGFKWNDSNRFNYGIGLGGGVDFWKFQFNIRYNWDIKKVGGKEGTGDPIYERYKLSKGRALEISLALFF